MSSVKGSNDANMKKKKIDLRNSMVIILLQRLVSVRISFVYVKVCIYIKIGRVKIGSLKGNNFADMN